MNRFLESLRRWSAPGALLILAVGIAGFAWWSLSVVETVSELRDRVSARVGWLQGLEQTRKDLESAEVHQDLLPATQEIGSIADEIDADPYASSDLVRASRATEIRASALAGGHTPFDEAHRHALEAELAALPLSVRRETAQLSRELGDHWNALSILVSVAIVSATLAFGLIAYLHFVLLSRERNRVASLYRGLASVDRLAAAGTLAAGVAHEVNNPLAIVKAALADLKVADEASRASLDTAITGAERIESIIADLHCYAEASEDSADSINLRSCAESALRLASSRLDSVPTDLEIEPTLWVMGSERRLIQALHNIFLNAAEAMQHVPQARRTLTIRAADDEEWISLQVIDTGPGLAGHVRRRAFEPFVTTKPVGQGTGLGLFVCHTLVTNMGGSLDLQSNAGGATVTLRLIAAAAPDKVQLPSLARRARVLLVDDEAALGDALAASLRDMDVHVVRSGEEALERLERVQFDAVLSDVRMPGMSGPQLVAQIRERWPSLARRVVFMSGGGNDMNEGSAALDARIPRLTKPFRVGVVRDALTKAIRLA